MIHKRWMLALVGRYSGRVTPVPFMSFWRRRSAEATAAELNARHNNLVTYELWDVDEGRLV